MSSDQHAEFDKKLGQLSENLDTVTVKLDLLHQPSADVQNADLYKQPESNLLSYIKALTASATSNVLDILESLPETIEAAKASNSQVLNSIQQQPESAEPNSQLTTEIREHLRAQDEVLETLSRAHSDILSLHSFQDLTSQAVIRAESSVTEIKSIVSDFHDTLYNLRGEEREEVQSDNKNLTDHDSPPPSNSQLDQDDVDSLFSSFRN